MSDHGKKGKKGKKGRKKAKQKGSKKQRGANAASVPATLAERTTTDEVLGPASLCELQAVVDRWIREHGGYWHEWANVARLAEETGEVAAAFQRLRGFRPRPAEADLGAELGDVLWVLLVIANQQGHDLATEFDRTLAKVTGRDGAAWKQWAAERG